MTTVMSSRWPFDPDDLTFRGDVDVEGKKFKPKPGARP